MYSCYQFDLFWKFGQGETKGRRSVLSGKTTYCVFKNEPISIQAIRVFQKQDIEASFVCGFQLTPQYDSFVLAFGNVIDHPWLIVKECPDWVFEILCEEYFARNRNIIA